ncbi:MAG TPA: SBBP repeat-containing protein [Dongiaceae bacterium]|nr:SBBP repeat-containing protein [Dongiaceae bacterium]
MKAAQLSGLLCLAALSGSAQVHQAWVNHYNGGYTKLDHRPVALALDGVGNVFVAGSSQSSATNYDYVVLKYASDGTQAWAARYAPSGGGSNTVAALALGQGGTAAVTGTAGTVGIGPGGAVAWAASYPGADLAADTNGNVYVTGLSTAQFATVKLDGTGSNVWLGTFNSHPGNPAASQKVGVDGAGSLYVAGWAPMLYFHPSDLYAEWLVKYDATGAQAWAHEDLSEYECPGCTVAKGLSFDALGNVYVTANGEGPGETAKFSPSGEQVWYTDGFLPPGVAAMAVDASGNVYQTGSTFFEKKLDSAGVLGTGTFDWLTNLAAVDPNLVASSGIALDAATNIYVCGSYTAGSANATDWATVKLDNNGNLLWRRLHSGPAGGSNGAVAIATAPDGSIYVTGYSANTSGGTDITTIRYVQDPTIQLQAGGAMLLQLPGLPGGSAGLAATTNFLNWTELGPVVANTNGLFQFTDTNAALYPHRFYRWH